MATESDGSSGGQWADIVFTKCTIFTSQLNPRRIGQYEIIINSKRIFDK